jgi:hypothetical protein
VRVLPCDHFFHRACIATWFDANKFHARSCPLCKRDPLADFWNKEIAEPDTPMEEPFAAASAGTAAPSETASPAAAAPTPVELVTRAPPLPEAALTIGLGTAASPQADQPDASMLDEISISITDDRPAVHGGV